MIIRQATEIDREALEQLSRLANQPFTDPWFWYNISSLVATDTNGEIVGGMTARPVAEIAMVLDWTKSDIRRGKTALALLDSTLGVIRLAGYDLAHAPLGTEYTHLARSLSKRGFVDDSRRRMIFDLVNGE